MLLNYKISQAVPKSIRKVPRPVYTVVVAAKSHGPLQYAVKERKAVRYQPGKNPIPVKGKVIGHIIDGRYVPVKATNTSFNSSVSQERSYGAAALVHSVCDDLRTDLFQVFKANDATKILTIAALRVIYTGSACNRLASKYEQDYIRVYYPGQHL